MSFLLWLALLQTSLAVNVPGPNGTVVTQILSATSSNPEVKVVEDRDLGKILVYPPQPKEFTVEIIARIMYPDDQYLEKISTVMVGGAGVTIESSEIRNSLILATLKVAPGASGGRFSITYENEDNPNHKGCNVRLLPVEIKVNDTIKEEDDLVPVSKGTDEDLATDFSVEVSGMGGLTADLKVKGADGGIKFKNQTLTLTDGVEAKTKLWGTSPSSDKDKTIIEITLKKDGKELGKIEEEVTVFKGAKLEFEGNYYINVDTRDWNRRPWDNRAEPKPNPNNPARIKHFADEEVKSKTPAELALYKKAVDQSSVFGYQSALSFKDGDNPEIPSYKPWKDKLEVKISKVMAKTPSFEIKDDKILDSILEFKKGVLVGPDTTEEIVDPQIKVGDFLTLHKTSVKAKIANTNYGAPTIGEAQIKAQINAQKGKGYDELLDYYSFTSGAPLNLSRPRDLAFASGFVFEWKNDSFDVKKEAKLKESFAAKAIRGEKEVGNKVEAKWSFTEWNEFKFQGLLKDAVIETK